MMKIMITGAAGFLGLALTTYYKQHNQLVLIDHMTLFDHIRGDAIFHENLIKNYDIKEDQHLIGQEIKDVDVVIHCANRARIDPSWSQYEDYYATNISATQSLFKLAQLNKVRKFIYISSSSVYGNNGTLTQSEDDNLIPTNPYAVSKMAGEWALRVQSQQGQTELCIIRPFTMYGDHMADGDRALVIKKFLDALEKDQPLLLHGGGEQRRDFIHIDDAIQGIDCVVQKGTHGEIYNLGSGKCVSIKQLADIVSDKQIMAPHRLGPVMHTKANISKLQSLGFQPTINVLEWLNNKVQEIKIKHHN